MENQIYNILNDMAEFLNVMQMKKLQKVLIYHLNEAKQVQEEISNEKYLEMFLTAKQIEGCSDRTIQYYRVTIEHMLKRITIPLRQIATEDIRQYLIDYQKIKITQSLLICSYDKKYNIICKYIKIHTIKATFCKIKQQIA